MEYYKCVSDEWGWTYVKGQIYSRSQINYRLDEYPNDWRKVENYPATKEIIDCIENGTNKSKVLKALKQWRNQK